MELLGDQQRSLYSLKYTSVWHKPPFLWPQEKKFKCLPWDFWKLLGNLCSFLTPGSNFLPSLNSYSLLSIISHLLHPALSSSPKSNHFYKYGTLAEFLWMVFRSWRTTYILSPTADNLTSDPSCPISKHSLGISHWPGLRVQQRGFSLPLSHRNPLHSSLTAFTFLSCFAWLGVQ